MICPKCGKELHDTATLCTSCGWKTQKWEDQKKNGKENHDALVFAMIAIVFLVVLFIALVVLAI